MARTWHRDDVLELARSYQGACVLGAAADFDLFTHLDREPTTAPRLAGKLKADPRGMTVLLDALAAMELLDKRGEVYHVPTDVAQSLTAGGATSVLAMAQHQARCLRRWADLGWVVKTGQPPERHPSIRGGDADAAAFIQAMDDVSTTTAPGLVESLKPMAFERLLDVGGASGTWTLAFLRTFPGTRATIFDLPHVIPMARRRIEAAGLADRVELVAGDFHQDPLPRGTDLVWLSAIVHMNSREQNRQLFQAARQALQPGGRVLIRDIVMEEGHTRPTGGALFAVNMLTGTQGGGTYTFQELEEDLHGASFPEVQLVRPDEGMNAVVQGR